MLKESLVAHQLISTGRTLYPYWSNLLVHLNDWASDNSSLFDGSSTCSTASTKDSTTEELWEHMSAESDSVSSNSSLIISETSDGFTCSPLGYRHWHLKADVPTPMIGPGSSASSSGREIDGPVAKRRSFLYSDNTEHSRNFNEIDKIRQNKGNSGELWRKDGHKNELPKHFIDLFGSLLRNLQV